MAEMPYVCLYNSYIQTLAPYTDAERGRIVMAMLNYSITGELPLFEGNERYIWPSVQSQIDRDFEAYRAKCSKNRENGSKGGRPPRNPTVTPETERLFEKPKKAKEKENEKENGNEKENESEKYMLGLPQKLTRFSPPSVDDVREYCNERGYTTIDPDRFISYYAARQWKSGQTAISDWRAAADSWHRKDVNNGNGNEKAEHKPVWTVGTVV